MNRPPALEQPLLRALLFISLLAWAFAEIAGEVVEGDAKALDHFILLHLSSIEGRPLGPRWLTDIALDITALGGPSLIALSTLAVSGFMALSRHRRLALLTLFSTAGGFVAVIALKAAFARARPFATSLATSAYGDSFPSGHAMMSAMVFLSLATLLARLLPRPAQRVYVQAWAIGLCALVGVSRIYLGAHWATDVLAGWAAGAAWAIACGQLAHHIDDQTEHTGR